MNNKKLVMRMFFSTIYFCLTLSFLPALGSEESQEVKTISIGMDLPQFTLDPPDSTNEQKYLGIEGLKPFSLSQISAKIVVMEIFSIYCPHCRKQAPALNKIYHFIEQDPKLSNGIKMIGIGTGSSKSQVEGWKTTLHVPFPLFSDPETHIWQKLGKPAVPCTLIMSSGGKVLETQYGAVEDVEKFFLQIKKSFSKQNQ